MTIVYGAPSYHDLSKAIELMGADLLYAQDVDTGHWQAVEDPQFTKTRELQNAVLVYPMPDTTAHLQLEVQPNLPWAEDHFQERVSRTPHNPPPSYEWWPFNKKGDEFQKDEKFSHTYPERFWPKHAGMNLPPDYPKNRRFPDAPVAYNKGIRYNYGDLDDVVNLLVRYPRTRQAWLPVWFPEDTGAVHGERVPCSLGYHFALRNGSLDCSYVIRSVDFLRHFRDDIYMAVRLAQWVLNELKAKELDQEIDPDKWVWHHVFVGELTMTMFSLHVFEGDLPMMRARYG